MFIESADPFLADFGVSALWYSAKWAVDPEGGATINSASYSGALVSQTALVLFDKVDNEVLNRRVNSVLYRITFLSSQFVGIKYDDAFVIATVKYKTQEVNSIDDGAWSEAILEAV